MTRPRPRQVLRATVLLIVVAAIAFAFIVAVDASVRRVVSDAIVATYLAAIRVPQLMYWFALVAIGAVAVLVFFARAWTSKLLPLLPIRPSEFGQTLEALADKVRESPDSPFARGYLVFLLRDLAARHIAHRDNVELKAARSRIRETEWTQDPRLITFLGEKREAYDATAQEYARQLRLAVDAMEAMMQREVDS